MTILLPGQIAIYGDPTGSLRISRGRGGAVPWWLAGGIPAANCIAVYQPKGAADYAASKVNLANPGTYDAFEGNAPAFDPLIGWSFTATSFHRLRTGIVPTLTYTIIARFANVAGSNRYILAATNAALSNGFVINQGNNGACMWWAGSTILRNGAQVASGVQALAGLDAYMDGGFIATLAAAGIAPDRELILGAYASGGQGALQGDLIAAAVYNINVTTKVSALTTAMAAL